MKALEHQRRTAGELLEHLRRVELVADLRTEPAGGREQR